MTMPARASAAPRVCPITPMPLCAKCETRSRQPNRTPIRYRERTKAMDDPVFTVSRTFQAPRALVWKAHSEIEHMAKWWGPKGFTWLKGTLDFRPGGMFHYGMRAPNGSEMWGKFVYREIAAPERIVFVNSFSDPACGTTRAPFAAGWPLGVFTGLNLTEQDGRPTP